MLTQEDKIKEELIKKIMTENKITLPLLRNQDRKKVKVETEKVNKLLINIATVNISELIYARRKLVFDKIEWKFKIGKGN